MVVGFTTTSAISAYHHSCELERRLWRGVLDTTLYDTVCQLLATGQWFSPGIPSVSSTNKTDRYDITEVLLKVALNTITQIFNSLVAQDVLFFLKCLTLHLTLSV